MENIQDYIGEMVVTYGPRLLGAILVLFIGLKIIKWFERWLLKKMEAKNVDPSLRPFFRSLAGTILRILLVISVMSMIGIQMTSFIAILGAAGLAVGLALSGALQNFAGGIMILIFKPFKVGDFINAQDHMGTVDEIQIFNTILKTPDHKTVIIPK
jgi:small conductance mechanosensitive channel